MARTLVIALAVLALSALGGCATNAVIADLEDDKAIVEVSSFAKDMEVIQAEAQKGCQVHEKKAVPISKRCVDQYCIRAHYLFACR